MKYAVVFGILALSLGWSAAQNGVWPYQLLLSAGGLCFAGVSLAYAGAGPRVFLKRADGRIAALGWAIFWPFHALNFVSLRLFLWRQGRSDTLISCINPQVFLGPRLGQREAEKWAKGAKISALDLAAELPETMAFRGAQHYWSLPVLDTSAPSLDDLRRGAAWTEARQNEGPVYVHCALGHGRSATFVAAFLMRSGRVASAREAIALIAQKRPGIELSAAQKRILEQFAE